MDFDFNLIGLPFAMRPALRRLPAGAPQLTPLAAAGRLRAEKETVLRAGASRHRVPGFDPAPALRAVAQHAQALGLRFEAGRDAPELAFEEDLAVLDGEDGTVPWLCVCVPSHWAPEEKVGLDFAALHAPVADNAPLLAASRQLVALATGGGAWERHVWTISPCARYDQHPRRHARAPWPAGEGNAEAFARQCWLRTERQTFLPVGQGTRQAVFTIRVTLQPLTAAVGAAWQARRLHDALASMSAAVLAYRHLTPARGPLLRWLAQRAREEH